MKNSEYLKCACQMVIDEFNEKYNYIDNKEQLRAIANEEYSQADICNKISSVFNVDVRHKNNSLLIKYNKLNITVHYLKGHKGDSGNDSNRITWKTLSTQFNNIENNIRHGHKEGTIYILAWFNCFDTFSKVVQLGSSTGNNPHVNLSKLIYFPFLSKDKIPTKTGDLRYNYSKSYKELGVDLIGDKDNINFNCMFLGNEEDKFHFAMYY